MKKAIFLPIFSFLIFVAVLYGLLPPLSKAQSLAGELAKQNIALQETKDYFANLQAVADQLDQNPDILANVAAALPEEFFLPSLMGFFQTTAAESGLLLRDFSYSEASGAPMPENGVIATTSMNSSIKITSFNLTLNGAIASLENFLKNLETSSRLLDVEQMSFQAPSTDKVSAGSGSSQESNSDFVILVKTYSY
ncbi:MAG: type 4a pilus biogenesis protein PilO [Patescibacteria group bacterium]